MVFGGDSKGCFLIIQVINQNLRFLMESKHGREHSKISVLHERINVPEDSDPISVQLHIQDYHPFDPATSAHTWCLGFPLILVR